MNSRERNGRQNAKTKTNRISKGVAMVMRHLKIDNNKFYLLNVTCIDRLINMTVSSDHWFTILPSFDTNSKLCYWSLLPINSKDRMNCSLSLYSTVKCVLTDIQVPATRNLSTKQSLHWNVIFHIIVSVIKYCHRVSGALYSNKLLSILSILWTR